MSMFNESYIYKPKIENYLFILRLYYLTEINIEELNT